MPFDDVDWDKASLVDQIEDRFHRRHEELYTYSSRDQEVVFVNARVAAIGEVPRGGWEEKSKPLPSSCKPHTVRRAFFNAWQETPVYLLDNLQPGHSFAGPAIVQAETTTVVVGASDQVRLTRLAGWILS